MLKHQKCFQPWYDPPKKSFNSSPFHIFASADPDFNLSNMFHLTWMRAKAIKRSLAPKTRSGFFLSEQKLKQNVGRFFSQKDEIKISTEKNFGYNRHFFLSLPDLVDTQMGQRY